MRRMTMALVTLALFGAGACSSDSKPAAGSGGSSGSGGGTAGSGGGVGSGGAIGSGGASGSGGTSGSGGASGSGGGSGGSGGASGTDGGSGEVGTDTPAGGDVAGSTTMSFFVTSVGAGVGGNLGGLDGADAKCKMLAMAVSAELGAKNWKAYLSTATVNARDRIGTGPWRNQKGEVIAENLTQLHDQGVNGTLNSTWPIGAAAVAKILDEKGMTVSTANPQQHDILTGTNMAGMVDGTNHCNNWTAVTGLVTVGHMNREGGGRLPSWNSAHDSPSGCAAVGSPAPNVTSGGGRGSIYCFAAN